MAITIFGIDFKIIYINVEICVDIYWTVDDIDTGIITIIVSMWVYLIKLKLATTTYCFVMNGMNE
jgi:hypothetical protein